MLNNCRLCEAIRSTEWRRPENTLLYQTAHFGVMPTIGQFVPGWLMLVSKTHSRCSLALSLDELTELSDLIQLTRAVLEECYGPTLIFEHGPGNSRSITGGCCVEHTHIHIVPCEKQDKFLSILPFAKSYKCSLVELPSVLDSEIGYLLIGTKDTGDCCRVFPVQDVIPRQYLRQILAICSNQKECWDWRRYPCFVNIYRTISDLQPLFASDSIQILSGRGQLA